jgi:hypothetical protein
MKSRYPAARQPNRERRLVLCRRVAVARHASEAESAAARREGPVSPQCAEANHRRINGAGVELTCLEASRSGPRTTD